MPGLLATLGLNAGAFKAGIDAVVRQSREAGKEIGHSLGELGSEKLLQFGSVAAVEELVRHVIELGDEISTTADRLGISTDAVQSWDYALGQSGSSIEAAVPFFEKLASTRKKALEGNEEMIASFKKFGITIEDLKNDRLEELGLKISEAFEGADPQSLIADLREVGGRGAGEMVAAFGDGFAEMVRGAKDAGVVMNEEVVNQLREAADSSKAIWTEFLTAIAPAVAGAVSMLKDIWHSMNIGVTGLTTMLYTGSVKAGNEAAEELSKQYEDQEKAKQEAAEKRKKASGLKAGLEETESSGARKKAEAEAKSIEELENRLNDKRNKNYLDSLSKEEKITELHRQRVALAEMLAKNWNELSEKGRLQAQLDIEDLQGQEDAAQRSLDKPKKKKELRADLNSLQQIGAYSGITPYEAQGLDVAKKSEVHLQGIKEGIATLVGNSRGGVRH